MTEHVRSHLPKWLQSVPRDWDVALLRLVARLESGHTPSRNHPEYWVPKECTIPWFSLADIWQLREGRQKYLGDTKEKISPLGMANSAARLLPAGTVVLSRTASIGFSGIMPGPMATTQDFANFVCGKLLLPDFLLWVLRGMQPEFERLRVGSTHQTIYMPDLLQFRIPVVPLDLQRAIADFLDRKTSAIDTLIEKKQRLLALLAEKRAVLIHRAVTKGLNPNVTMKDSGLEWVKQIPAHWSIVRLKHLANVRGGVTKGRDLSGHKTVSVPYLRVANVQDGYVDLTDVSEIEVLGDEVERYSLHKGDILMNEGGDNDKLGRGCVWEAQIEPCLHQNHVFCVRPYRTTNPYWISLCISANYLRYFFLGRAKQATNLASISSFNLKDAPILLPPVGEQYEILRWIVASTQSVDSLADRLKLSITRLREYRQSLITAAVTGQLDLEATP